MSRRLILKALTEVLGKPDHPDKAWVNFTCPFCSGKFKFGVNLESGRTRCFKCESRPPLALVFKLLGKPLPLGSLGSRPRRVSLVDRLRFSREAREENGRPVNLSDWARLPHDDMSRSGNLALRYAVRRGADPEYWEFGTIDHDPYLGRVVFMIREHGVPVSFQARDFTGRGHPKTLNPPPDEGFPVGQVLFGLEHVQPGGTVMIVEGIFDAVSATCADGVFGVALLGKVATKHQLDRLCRLKDVRYVVALDPGTERESNALYKSLAETGKDVRLVDWSPYSADDDPNSVGPRGCRRLLSSARTLDLRGRVQTISRGWHSKRDLRWRGRVRGTWRRQ